MKFKNWLKDAVKHRTDDYRALLPELKLQDGTELSIQASESHMCYPKLKLDNGNYYTVEVYTHGVEIKELLENYSSDPFDKYIYGNVDVDFMDNLCELHGWIIE